MAYHKNHLTKINWLLYLNTYFLLSKVMFVGKMFQNDLMWKMGFSATMDFCLERCAKVEWLASVTFSAVNQQIS